MGAAVLPPFSIITDVDGDPLKNGYIYIGAAGLEPSSNPIAAFWDAALTIPAAQPIRTVSGYPSRSGSPGRLYVSAPDYSLLVRDKNSSLVYSSLSQNGVGSGTGSASVSLVSDIRGNDWTGFETLSVSSERGNPDYYLDSADTTSADDDFLVIVDAGGNRWKLVHTSVVNVLNAGATGDGIADDTAAILKAVSSGLHVYFPGGDYRISSEINPNNDQMLFGNGKLSRIFSTTGVVDNAHNLIVAVEKFNVVIWNLYVEGTHYGDAFPTLGTFTGMGVPVLLVGCTNCYVKDCHVYNGGGYISAVNQGVGGIYLSSSTKCKVLNNWVTNGQNGIVLDTWYSQLAGGSKASFKLGLNTVSGNHIWNLQGAGIAIDDELATDQLGGNIFANNNIYEIAYKGIAATFSRNLQLVGNVIDGYGVNRTQGSNLGVAVYYGIYTNGCVDLSVTGGSIKNCLVNNVFSYNPQRLKINNVNMILNGTDADPEAIGAIGSICIIATASNVLEGLDISGNTITRDGAVGAAIPAILLQVGAVTARYTKSKVNNNTIKGFNGAGVSIPTASTTKTDLMQINDNNVTGGTEGVYCNGVINSRMNDNVVSGATTGYVDVNGANNDWTGTIENCSDGFAHIGLTGATLKVKFVNISGTAIYGAGATSGFSDASESTFINCTTLKGGVSTASFNNLRIRTFASAEPVSGGWGVLDEVINTAPVAGGYAKWLCLTAGSAGAGAVFKQAEPIAV